MRLARYDLAYRGNSAFFRHRILAAELSIGCDSRPKLSGIGGYVTSPRAATAGISPTATYWPRGPPGPEPLIAA